MARNIFAMTGSGLAGAMVLDDATADRLVRRDCVNSAVLRFLLDPGSYGRPDAGVRVVESHMSLVFLVNDRAYKMKKPVRLDRLDYRHLSRRLENCERELVLNRALAPEIYLGLAVLTRDGRGDLHFGAGGKPVEWLVVMKRLDESRLLSQVVPDGVVDPKEIAELSRILARFYAQARRVDMTEADLLHDRQAMLERNRQSLGTPEFALPAGQVDAVISALQDFLLQRADLITARAKAGWVRDCHGDLRPEHVYLGPPLCVIDRLEFDERLRWCDPFDEVVDLGVECERLGAPWFLPMLVNGLAVGLGDRPDQELLDFYGGMRACLRARLAIEHLRRDGDARRWRARARACLDLAAKYACPQS